MKTNATTILQSIRTKFSNTLLIIGIAIGAVILIALLIMAVVAFLHVPGFIMGLVEQKIANPNRQKFFAGILGSIMFFIIYVLFGRGGGFVGTSILVSLFSLGYAVVHLFKWLF